MVIAIMSDAVFFYTLIYNQIQKTIGRHNISEISTLLDKDNGLITNYKLVLLDKNNHIVRQHDIIGNTESVSMDIDGLNPNLYILQLMSGNELIDSQKVMIR